MDHPELMTIYDTPNGSRNRSRHELPAGVTECSACGGSGVSFQNVNQRVDCHCCDGVGFFGIDVNAHDYQPGSPFKVAQLAMRYRRGWIDQRHTLFHAADERVSTPDLPSVFQVPDSFVPVDDGDEDWDDIAEQFGDDEP